MTLSIGQTFRNKQGISLSTSTSVGFSVLGIDIFLFTRLPAWGRKPTWATPTRQYRLVFLVGPCKPRCHWLVNSTGTRHFLSRVSHTAPRPETIDGSHWGETSVPNTGEWLTSQETSPAKPVCWERLTKKTPNSIRVSEAWIWGRKSR